MTLYWKSNCSVSREAHRVVLGLDGSVNARNFHKVPLTADEVRGIVGAAGSITPVLNVRHPVARERGWKDHPPELAEFVTAVMSDSNLLRRPILLGNGQVVVGQHEADWRALLRG